MILVVLMYAAFAATFPLAKLAVAQTTSPLFFLALRMLCAGLGMLFYSLLVQKERPKLTTTDFFDLVSAGFFAIFVAFGFEFWAIQYVSSVKVNIFYSLSPFVTALLARITGQEQLSARKIVGLCIGFGGMIPLSLNALGNGISAQIFPTSLYDGALLISVISAAYAWFIIKRLINRGYPLLFINGAMTLLGGLMCGVAHIYSYSGVFAPVYSWPSLLLYMSLLIMISNVLGYTMYGMLLRKYSLTFLSFSGFMCPLFGMLYGFLLMGEPFSMTYILSLGCVFAGLSLFYWDEQISNRA